MFDEFLDSWEDYVESPNANLYDSVYQVVSKTVLLPEPSLYFRLIAIFACTSIIYSKILPRIFCYGAKGTGKSELTKLIAKVRGQKILASKTTYASIRNIINASKQYDPELGAIPGNEKDGGCLCWDNLRTDSLILDTSLYQLLISGYSKATSIIEVSSGVTGKNLVFDCYCPAIFSSVFPLHIELEFDELHRRMLVIPHKKAALLTNKELEANEAISGIDDAFDKIAVDETDFSGLQVKFYDFWNQGNIAVHQVERRALLKHAKSKTSKFRELPSDFFLLISDLLATGLTIGAFHDIGESESFALELFESQKKVLSQSESATEVLLLEFINQATENQTQINEKLLNAGLNAIPLRVPATDIKAFLDSLSSQGRLDKQIRVKERNNIMNALGYRLDKDGWVEIK